MGSPNGNGNGKGYHEKPVMATSHEYDALRRDIKAVRDQQVSDLETLATKIHASREHAGEALERLAGQVLGLHQANIANVNEVSTKVDALAAAVLAHIEADAEWKATFRHRLAVEHDRTSEIEYEVDARLPSAHVLGVSSDAWKRFGQVIAATVAAVAITSCAVRYGIISPVPTHQSVSGHLTSPDEGP